MVEENKKVIKELTSLLEKCDVGEYILDTRKKELTIVYIEDFKNFYPKINAKPVVEKNNYTGDNNKVLFNYKGWFVFGNTHMNKPK